MKEENELPYIDNIDVFSAEFRKLKETRLKNKIDKTKVSTISKKEKIETFEKTNGVCHICGINLPDSNFSITTSYNDELKKNLLPACTSCKKIYDNYSADEIRWMLKIGLWAKTQIEFETDLGKEMSIQIIEEEKHRESRRKEKREPLQLDLKMYPLKQNMVIGSKKNEYKKIKEVLFWSYANLGMAGKAVDDKSERYSRLHFIIRKKLFDGLMSGKMNPRSLFHDEKSKLDSGKCCVYCGKTTTLQIDHIIARKKGGKDAGENLVWACRSCNASKNDKDLLEWYNIKQEFPPIQILRNYLKLVMQYCTENNLMDEDLDTSPELNLPFSIVYIPLEYPQPYLLIKRYEV